MWKGVSQQMKDSEWGRVFQMKSKCSLQTTPPARRVLSLVLLNINSDHKNFRQERWVTQYKHFCNSGAKNDAADDDNDVVVIIIISATTTTTTT